MTLQWFFKGVITCLIIHFMGVYGEANVEEKQEDEKYLKRLGLSRTAKDEKAFEMVKDHIKEVLKQEEGRNFYNPKEEGPRTQFYKKYMKLGKARDELMNIDNKKTQHLNTHHNTNKFQGNTKNSEKKMRDFQHSSAETRQETKDVRLDKLNEYSQADKWKKRPEYNILPGRISNNNKLSKVNYSVLNNSLVNTSLHLNNEENFPENIIHQTDELDLNDENFKMMINTYLDQIKNKKDKYSEKRILNDNRKITDYKNKEEISRIINDYQKENSLVNSILGTSKDSQHKKKRKCYRPDNETSGNKKTQENSNLQPNDHRRVRSCDIKMEDLRESFIPNEQLSIYHPKMSLSDQFILQDTMF